MLETLIQKLTGSEKRYFVLQNETFKRNPEHLRLYKYLSADRKNKQSLMDFEGGYSGNRASLKKRYLKNSLLDSLRSYNKDNTVGIIIMNHIQDAEIFYRKLLFEECIKSLKKAKRLAVKHERFGLHLEILNWERRLIGSTMEIYEISEKMIDKEEEGIHEKNNNELWARKLQTSAFEFKKKHGFLDKNQVRIFSKEFRDFKEFDEVKIKSRRATFYYFWMLTLYHTMTGDHESSFKVSRKINEEFLDVVDPEDLYFGMLEHVTSCMYTHRYRQAIKELENLRKIKENPYFKGIVAIEERFYYYHKNYSIISHTVLGNESVVRKIIKVVDRDIRQRSGLISEQMMKVVRSSLSQVYFTIGNYQKAKEFCMMILSDPKGEVREDIQKNVKILFLLILLELEQYDLLESEVISSKNFFKQNTRIYRHQLKIIDSFKGDFTKKDVARDVIRQINSKFKENAWNLYFEDLILLMWGKSVLNETTSMIEFKRWRGHMDP